MQLGQLCGLSASVISGFELNTVSPSKDSLAAIALALDGDLNQMVGIKPKRHKVIIVDHLSERQRTAIQILVDELEDQNV